MLNTSVVPLSTLPALLNTLLGMVKLGTTRCRKEILDLDLIEHSQTGLR